MEKEEVLHTDSDEHNVMPELDEAGNPTGWVRYKKARYQCISARIAAEKILKGQEIKNCYIMAVTVEALAAAEKELKTGHFLPKGSIEIDGKKREGPVLKQPIRCGGCLIGEIGLQGLIFERDIQFFLFARVSEETCMLETCILGDADFSSASFGGSAHFTRASFGGCGDFSSASFGGGADFTAMLCSYGAFTRATFKGKARFYGAAFDRYANFCQATFGDDVAFSGVTFGRKAGFREATCGGKADFRRSAMLSFDLGHARFDKLCDMTEVAAGKVNLKGTVFAENALLSSPQSARRLQSRQEQIGRSLKRRERKVGIPEELEQLREWQESKRGIYSIDFGNTLVLGDLVCDFEDLRPQAGKPVIKPHREGKWDEARKQYAWLKEQFRRRSAYKDEDEAHWFASECSRKNAKRSRPLFLLCIAAMLLTIVLSVAIHAPGRSYVTRELGFLTDCSALIVCALLAAILVGFPRHGMWLIYRKVFGYGVKPMNMVFTIVAVILVCSVLFCCAYYTGKITSDSGPSPFISAFLNGLYFSVITFATVGYGDLSPTGWAAGLAMVEGLLGVALNAILVVLISRKLTR